jgi:hypothetical protein
MLCQGLSLDEAQALFNANDRVSEAGREVIDASATQTNTGVSITNDNEDVNFKLHNSPMTSEVLSDSLLNAGILSGHQFNVGNRPINISKRETCPNRMSTNCRILMHFRHLHHLTTTCHYLILKPCCHLNCLAYHSNVTTCHCYHETNCLAYQSVTTCHWYHQTNCLASQRVTTCHHYSSVMTCHCLSNLTTITVIQV